MKQLIIGPILLKEIEPRRHSDPLLQLMHGQCTAGSEDPLGCVVAEAESFYYAILGAGNFVGTDCRVERGTCGSVRTAQARIEALDDRMRQVIENNGGVLRYASPPVGALPLYRNEDLALLFHGDTEKREIDQRIWKKSSLKSEVLKSFWCFSKDVPGLRFQQAGDERGLLKGNTDCLKLWMSFWFSRSLSSSKPQHNGDSKSQQSSHIFSTFLTLSSES